MSFGFIIVLIALFGYASNWLNWRFLNFGFVRSLYYLGAFVHEGSHALVCLLTGAKITEFEALSSNPHVAHGRSKLPIVGGTLISLAPIFGGLAVLFLLDRFVLGGHLSEIGSIDGWRPLLNAPADIFRGFKVDEWQSWVMALLLLNVGAMLGPSPQDLKNMWLSLVILCFVPIPILSGIGFAALGLITAGIAIQFVCIALIAVIRLGAGRF